MDLNSLKGKYFIFASVDDERISKIIESKGGVVLQRSSKNLNFVILKNEEEKKVKSLSSIKYAIQNNIAFITYDQFDQRFSPIQDKKEKDKKATKDTKATKDAKDTKATKDTKVTKDKKKKSPKEKENELISRLKNTDRHCISYSDTSMQYPLDPLIDLKSRYRRPYDSKVQVKTNVHLGQRKLLLSEIQFLTQYYKKNEVHPILLYVGSAPGSHLILLHQLFPFVQFILYDGAKFDVALKKTEFQNKNKSKNKIVFEIHEGEDGFVTSPKCEEIKKRLEKEKKLNRLLFVSDIRLTEENRQQFELAVNRDMKLQEEWVQILEPVMSLLKFRMPYHLKKGDKINYMKGDLYYGIWPKATSGESRLMVLKKDVNTSVSYDFNDYEETMFFHNTQKRPFCYDNKGKENKDISELTTCTCFDCLSELNILKNYMDVIENATIYPMSFKEVVESFRAFMKPVPFPSKAYPLNAVHL